MPMRTLALVSASDLTWLELQIAFEYLVKAFSRVDYASDECLAWLHSFLNPGVSHLSLKLTP